ncbi:MAG: SUMF1/EgtB/PvdO family nonheme iron enzyme [Polyangiaceae bacterium]
MQSTTRYSLLFAAYGLFAACSSNQQTASNPPPQADKPPAPSTQPSSVPPAESSAPVASASASASAGPVAGPSACPDDMVLIDGDYCTNLEVKCKKSHYAKANKKTICEEFAEPTKCIGSKVAKRYCIDKYEFPNKKGENPEVMNDFPHAQKKCAALGKRVCTETEWTMACEGPSYKPYPYGYVRDPNKCRGDRPYKFPKKMSNGMLLTHSKDEAKAQAEISRLWDAVPSGSQPDCVSDYGVFDMPGNADELAASEGSTEVYSIMQMPKGNGEILRAADKFDNVTTGGPWVEGVRNQCRPKIYTHNEGFSYYYLSFRCCAETDGKPTDPRSPKQIRRGEKWKD